jgi:NADH-quinone oxidoreductase subunit G
LRKAVRKNGLPIYAIAPFVSSGLRKMGGTLLSAIPGEEPCVLDGLHIGDIADLLREPGAVILVGERLAAVPGGLSAVTRLADGTGARLAWVPRRAGERGALEAGALPNLLPGGRPTAGAGRDTEGILAAARDGRLSALLVGGVEPGDLVDPDAALAALDNVDFLVSLELRRSQVTDRADVVFPIASVAEKAGSFLNWEGRQRRFSAALPDTGALSDLRVLDALATEMGVDMGLGTADAAREELHRLGSWDGQRAGDPELRPAVVERPLAGQAILAGWRLLLDSGRLQDGEPHLAGTARDPTIRLSAATAAEIGAAGGDSVAVSTPAGAITLPLTITDMPDRVVWLPLNSPGSAVHQQLGVTAGAVVSIGVSS